APAEVFRNLRRHPRWLVALLVMSLLSAVYSNLFMNRLGAERIANFAIDKTLEMPIMNDQAKAQVEAGRPQAIADAKNPVVRTGQAVSGFAGSVFLTAFLALIFFLFALAMGGKLNYWQSFSIATYAAFPVAVIRFVLNSIVLHVKDPTDIHPITGQSNLIQDNLNFLFTPSEHPVLYTIAGVFSLLMFYWVWLNATGLKNGGERVSGSIAWTASIAIFVMILCLASVMALLFPGFIS
ncbi:MAG TPA: YIP1 family protein, partial [Pyrinomonadaceae bacterium]|nr:YIP1 family protein [Pyrinomonadaceae bacterium]